ncbi:hypothetical protein [Vibrio sp. PNB22_4_1]
MKYSPLTIHCASLCLDILSQHRLLPLSHHHIDDMQADIYAMIEERATSEPLPQYRLKQVLENSTHSIMSVLHQSLEIKNQPNVNWILDCIEAQVTHSIRSAYYLR